MERTTGKFFSQEGGLLNLLGPLMWVGLPLMKNVFTLLAKSILIPLGLTAAASVTDAALQKKIYGSCMITLIISNKEMKDMKMLILLKNGIYW